MKIAKTEQDKEMIELIIKDLNTYIYQKEDDFKTTQHLVGMDLIFKGWVMKNWVNVNETQSYVMKKLNKAIVKRSMLFYSEAWKHQNEVIKDGGKYREYVLK